jgi:hypothetical protein
MAFLRPTKVAACLISHLAHRHHHHHIFSMGSIELDISLRIQMSSAVDRSKVAEFCGRRHQAGRGFSISCASQRVSLSSERRAPRMTQCGGAYVNQPASRRGCTAINAYRVRALGLIPQPPVPRKQTRAFMTGH